MKHILPILTLTTLAAAASAQAAAPAGLSYNRVTVSREGQNNTMSASALLGGTNVLASVSSSRVVGSHGEDNNETVFSLGYVFKNVAFATDATVSISSGNQDLNSAVSVNLRRALNEVYAGLEVAVGYSYASNSDSGAQGDPAGTTGVVSAEIAYNVNKTWQVAVGLSNQNPTEDRTTTVSVRHNF
jgi:hypothetical protein